MQERPRDDIPDDVYVQFVRSLFNSVHMIIAGAVIHSLAAFLAFWDSGKPVYLGFSLILLLVGAWRYAGMLRVKRTETINSRAEAERWERFYIIRGTIQILALASFCFVGIYFDSGYFAAVAALSVTVGSMPSVVGRNYGSARMVKIFAIATVLPIGAGFVMHGQLPYIVLGILIIPFYLIIKGTSDHVREVLFSAVVGHKEARRLAHRFNRALNTMSHGLVMLNPDETTVVANARAAEMLGFQSSEQLLGRSLKALLMRGVASRALSTNDCAHLATQLSRALRDGRDRKLLLKLSDGRYFEFSAREGDDELGVITFEEVTARVEAEEKVRYMARYDSLTGLPNRAYFHEVVAELMASGDRDRLCGLAVFDLDDFKSINDTLGHPVGDGLIYAVAERLAAFTNDDVKVSRFGGDEFMIFANRIEEKADFADLLDRIFSEFQGEVDVAGHVLRVQASAGAVTSRVREADVDAMVVKADLALYKAKELGKNGWRLFEKAMDAEFRSRQVMKADLRSAIEARRLRAVYQPIVSMGSMRIEACEALCRWDHPELGPISPSVFIPLAEEMGVVSEISSFILAKACVDCAKWPEHICVSVNMSANDFRDGDIVDLVRRTLESSGLAPHRLEIEVTETALLDDKASTRKYLEELKALGVRVALDDFGTGYSSLSYLHTLPLDKVKIDGSFLVDVTGNKRSLELLKGVVNLSRPLGLSVTMEGVETFEQLKLLADSVKPDLVQGFLFGSPLTASGIEAMAVQARPFAAEFGRLAPDRASGAKTSVAAKA